MDTFFAIFPTILIFDAKVGWPDEPYVRQYRILRYRQLSYK